MTGNALRLIPVLPRTLPTYAEMDRETQAAIHDINSKVGALRYLVERLYCDSFKSATDPVAAVETLGEDTRVAFEKAAATHGVEDEAIPFQEFLNVFFEGVVRKLRDLAGSSSR